MQKVKQAYEQLGAKYLDYRSKLKSEPFLKKLLRALPQKTVVLDVGCGPGVGVDDTLVKHGHEVIGVDFAPAQIKIARKNVPGAAYILRDMRELGFGEYKVGAVVCLYALFHIPRVEHKRMVETFASYLSRGGLLLISMGDRAFEGEHDMYGVLSYSSQWGREINRQLVERAGFDILDEEIATSGGERHQMILASKRERKRMGKSVDR